MSESNIDPNKYWADSIAESQETKMLSFAIPKDMATRIDAAVFKQKQSGKPGRASRSSFIREAIAEKLEREGC